MKNLYLAAIILHILRLCNIVNCEEVRRDLYRKFNNRAWPVNVDCLTGIIRYRDKLARKVGFKNFSEFDLDSEMVKKLETAEEFLNNLATRSKKKAVAEIENFLKELPGWY